MKLGDFFYLIPTEQQMMLCIECVEKHAVTGTADAIGYITNIDINKMRVISVSASDGLLKVLVEDENA